MANQDKYTAKIERLLRDHCAQLTVPNLSYESGEAAHYLGRDSESIRRYIMSGRLPAIFINHQCMIEPHVQADFIESRVTEAA